MSNQNKPKPIVALWPEVATPEITRRLQRAGYCVIVTSKPEGVQAIDVATLGSLESVSRCAMQAIANASGSSSVPEKFGRMVATRLARTKGDDDVG